MSSLVFEMNSLNEQISKNIYHSSAAEKMELIFCII